MKFGITQDINKPLIKNYSNTPINIDDEIASLFEKDYPDDAFIKVAKTEPLIKDIKIYVDMSDNFIITKNILQSIYAKLSDLALTFDKNYTYNIKIILVSPMVKLTYMEYDYRKILESFIDETNNFATNSKNLSSFPNYSRLKSHVNFINNSLNKWLTTINFTKSVNALPKHINKKVQDVSLMFKNKKGSDFTINIDIENKKIYNIKTEDIDNNSIIIPKESDNVLTDIPLHESFISNITKAIQYRDTLIKNKKVALDNKNKQGAVEKKKSNKKSSSTNVTPANTSSNAIPTDTITLP